MLRSISDKLPQNYRKAHRRTGSSHSSSSLNWLSHVEESNEITESDFSPEKTWSAPNVLSLDGMDSRLSGAIPLHENDLHGQSSKSPADHEGNPPSTPPPSQEHTNWLLRFFQSELFDASLALHYLYRSKSKDTGVQQYLGKLISVQFGVHC